MKHLLPLCILLSAFCIGSASAATLTGIVTNDATGSLLEDATIEIKPTNTIIHTDNLGRFRANLPPGNYTISASYTDLDTMTKTLVITPDSPPQSLDFPLTSQVYQLETFVVTGEREGNAAAITRQQTADNIKNVVSLDAYGYLSNDNPADLLVRLPGISGNADEEGNVYSVNVRGIDSSMNMVTYDGAQMATSAGMSSRNFRFLNINASSFEELEVIKAPTPNMDASSLGGTINMKTKTTLNMKENLLFTYKAGLKIMPSFFDYTPRRDNDVGLNFSLGYKQIFSVLGGRRNLGLSLDLYNADNITNKAQTRMDWEYTENNPAYVSAFRTYDGTNTRQNTSATLRLDYKLSDTSRFYLSLMYSRAKELPDPGMEDMNSYINISRNYGNFDMNSLTNRYTEFNYGSMNLLQGWMGFLDQQYRAQFGAEHTFSNWTLDYNIAYSASRVNFDCNSDLPYAGKQIQAVLYGIAGTIDRTSSVEFPTFTQTGGPSAYIVNNYLKNDNTSRPYFYLYDRSGGTRTNDVVEAKANAKTALSILGQPVELTTGIAFRYYYLAEKNNNSRWTYDQNGDISQYLADIDVDPRFNYGTYNLPRFDIQAVSQDLTLNPDHWTKDVYYSLEQNHMYTYDLTEKISAAYLMARTRFGKLGILAGARVEMTDYFGHAWKRIDTYGSADYPDPYARFEANFGNSTTRSADTYSDIFPGLHFTYQFTKNLLARASWSTSCGRPGPRDLITYLTIDDTMMEIRASPAALLDASGAEAKALVPQYSNNLDLSLEYYIKPAGIFSVGLFRKDIQDFLYTTSEILGTDPNDGFGGQRPGYTLYTKHNGNKATVDGIELSYSQNLDAFASFLKGFNITLNYTRLRTDGDYSTTSNDPTKPLPKVTGDVQGFVPSTANARLRYNYKKFSAYVALNYTGENLTTYSERPGGLIYREARTSTDIGFGWNFNRYLQFNLTINNLLNEPFVKYQGTKNHRYETIYNGPIVNISLSGRF